MSSQGQLRRQRLREETIAKKDAKGKNYIYFSSPVKASYTIAAIRKAKERRKEGKKKIYTILN